jgi:hypothetical protein
VTSIRSLAIWRYVPFGPHAAASERFVCDVVVTAAVSVVAVAATVGEDVLNWKVR